MEIRDAVQAEWDRVHKGHHLKHGRCLNFAETARIISLFAITPAELIWAVGSVSQDYPEADFLI